MIGLIPHCVREAEAVQYLQRPGLNPIGMATPSLGVPLVYEERLHTATGHPCCSHKAPNKISACCYQLCDLGREMLSTHPAGPAPTMRLEKYAFQAKLLPAGRSTRDTHTSTCFSFGKIISNLFEPLQLSSHSQKDN